MHKAGRRTDDHIRDQTQKRDRQREIESECSMRVVVSIVWPGRAGPPSSRESFLGRAGPGPGPINNRTQAVAELALRSSPCPHSHRLRYQDGRCQSVAFNGVLKQTQLAGGEDGGPWSGKSIMAVLVGEASPQVIDVMEKHIRKQVYLESRRPCGAQMKRE